MVVSICIDISKDKHDCSILSSEGEILADVFAIPNMMDWFYGLLQRIQDCTHTQDKIIVGLEATGHYSYNLLGFLLDNGLATYGPKSLVQKPLPKKPQSQKDQNKLGGCTNDYVYVVVRCGPQTLHRYSILQQGVKVTD